MKKLALLAAAAFLVGAAPEKNRPVVAEFTQQTRDRCTHMTYGDEPRLKGKPPAGTRCARLSYGPKKGDGFVLPNTAPAVVLSTAASSRAGVVVVRAAAKDAEDRNLLYTFSITTGTIKGDGGPKALWSPGASARPGRHMITAEVDDGCGCISVTSAEVAFSK